MGHRLLKGISLLLGALTGCGEPDTDDSWGMACPEYGCSSFCSLHGRVVDAASGDPIEGIQVSRADWGGDTLTDAAGAFVVDLQCCEDPVTLTVEDIDGDEHGAYASQQVEVPVQILDQGPCFTEYEQRDALTIELEAASRGDAKDRP